MVLLGQTILLLPLIYNVNSAQNVNRGKGNWEIVIRLHPGALCVHKVYYQCMMHVKVDLALLDK